MNKKILLFFFITLAFGVSAFAGTNTTAFTKHVSLCSQGAALQQFQCFQGKLNDLEVQMNDLTAKAKDRTSSMWGKEAVKELQDRFLKSQDAWMTYRNEYCMRDYYIQAPVHPPSLSLSIAACKYDKTKGRIEEIQNTYLK